MLWSLCPQGGNNSHFPMGGGLGAPQSRFCRGGEENKPSPFGDGSAVAQTVASPLSD